MPRSDPWTITGAFAGELFGVALTSVGIAFWLDVKATGCLAPVGKSTLTDFWGNPKPSRKPLPEAVRVGISPAREAWDRHHEFSSSRQSGGVKCILTKDATASGI